ncbi:MAG TPA: sulfatase [Nocardioides sp.]|nr:sulfatase [Nocardioides sp.]
MSGNEPAPRIAGHGVVRLVVDNTGDRIGATVVHQGGRWRGATTLELDVTGDARPELRAVVGHGTPSRSSFTRTDGSPWRCAGRVARSEPGSTRTVLSLPRTCAARAPHLQVRAVTSGRGGPDSVASSREVAGQPRPNVVMIMVDDMRADDLQYMPWTQRLIADRGATFTNSFSPYPLCCPARVSALTGRYSHNHGVLHVFAPYGFTSFDDRSTVATWLRRAGYATVYVGKYLNGYGWMPRPGERTGKSLHYVPPGWTDWRASIDGGLAASDPRAGSTYDYFDTTLSRDGRGFTSYEGQYQTHVFGDLSERIVQARAASDRPFFLYVSYLAPHHGLPVEPDDTGWLTRSDGVGYRLESPARPESVKGMFDTRIYEAPGARWKDPDWSDKPPYLDRPAPTAVEKQAMLNLTRQRAEALWVVDRQVRRTIDALARTGELDETLVVFTSDNGYFLGEQRKRHRKSYAHDPSLRVPLLMRGPGIPAGVKRSDPYMSMDFAPTVADLAGVRVPDDVDGMSMLGVARHGDVGWTRPVLTQSASVTSATNDWSNGIRTDRYLYIRQYSGAEELYDMAKDPQQYDNLVGVRRYADELALLRAEHDRMRVCAAATCREPLPARLRAGP